ncbi:MAG: trimethylamine methyltransferase family protein [Proteobacteria bacterium]|nr:trimethylamine methyltransferase family protein [Pseudomonadota bacterium]MBU1581985.1 trimethylamine methyltransferase family protein [Pseudomonadota bacterium]MBU2454700.1 trimethylamine methyltransferase family protein [Pseudomonadota bacterium]MBU2628950.1 trimethylamine methyltransferase family protein [Pseudomonadota bacterium]
MNPTLNFLTPADIETIHECSLKILREIGMRFPAKEALEFFERAGATIIDNDIVRMDESLVNDALKKTLKRNEMTLFALDPEKDVSFASHDPGITCMTMATSVIDPWSGKKRSATNKDLEQLVRIADQLEHIKVSGGPVTPQDVEYTVCDWHTWATCMKNTTKHITGGVLGYRGVKDAIEMGSIAAGSREAFLKRPFISGWVLTLPPLSMDTASLEAMMEMNRNNIPIMLSSGPILGNTSPVTIPGMVAQAHAEILACITLSQLINPGAPLVYTSFARGMNMKTTNISMAGPEFAVLKVAMSQMGLFLDLPIRMPSMLRDAKVLDAQAGFETGMVGTLSSFNADIMDAMQLDTDMVVDYPDLVFCNDCMAFIQHALRDISVDSTSLAFDVIKEVGPGGNFLATQHTFNNFKTELWHSDLFDHDNWDNWEAKGSKTIRDKALEKVCNMLEQEAPSILSSDQELAIDKIVEKAAKEL